MSATWATILALTAVTIAARATGPLLVGGRSLSPAATRVIALTAPALLAALVVSGTFTTSDGALTLDARTVGLAAAAAVLAVRRKALLSAVLVAALATALARML
jgi:branched-subunit amino acid transport protein